MRQDLAERRFAQAFSLHSLLDLGRAGLAAQPVGDDREHQELASPREDLLDRQRQSGEHAGIRCRRQRVMIDKIGGEVAYAVISFGGFLGMGEDYYPLPWASLKYDTNLGGYRVGVTEDQLKGAPKYNRNTEWDWSDRSRDKTIYDYYRAPLWYT